MMTFKLRSVWPVVAVSAALSGCQNLPDYHLGTRTPAPVRVAVPSRPVVTPAQPPVPREGVTTQTVPPAAIPPSLLVKPAPAQPVRKLADGRDMPAVQGLLASAEMRLQQGDLEEAANSLERAQRLAPQSSAVYLKLSETRLRQNRVLEAEQLARKVLAFAQGAAQQAALWRLVAMAAERQGKAETAAQARQKAEQLESSGDRS